jgi:rhamnosyltransferase subunit B
MYADLSRAVAGADFLISGEVVLAAPLVAEKRDLPWAAAILAPFSFFSIHDPPVFPLLPGTRFLMGAPPLLQRLMLAVGKLVTRGWGKPIADLRRSLGLRPTRHPLVLDRFSPHLNLAMFSEVLGKPQVDWPTNTVQTGFVFYDDGEAAPESLADFLACGAPPITFTLGSTAVMDPGRFFEESAAAARLLGSRALLLMGRNVPPPDLSQDVFAAGYAPYSLAFPRSAAVVHQGGVGTTAQALRAGVPQLVMPYAFDQPDNAARVRRSGAGLSIKRERYEAVSAANRLRTLLRTPSYAERAGNAGFRVRSENGVIAACAAVERTMASLCH